MALFFLVLFSTKPHLHDKQCHFEAACVISPYLSLIPDLLLLPLIFLFLFFLSTVIHFFFLSPPPFHPPSFPFIFDISLCAKKQVFGSEENGKDISAALIVCYII